MRQDPRLAKLQRLRSERMTRASGAYYGTRATAYGNVQHGPRPRNTGRTLLSLIVFAALIVAVVYLAGHYLLTGLHPAAAGRTRTVVVTIKPGESSADVASQLQGQGLVFNATVFHWYLRLSGSNVLAGPHRLNTNMTMQDVAIALGTAPPAAPTATVQIADGWRAEQVAGALDQHGVAHYADLMNEIERGSFSYSFLADRPAGAGVEGYLMPDTYQFKLNDDPHHAIDRMLQNFAAQVSPGLVAQGKRLYGSFYKAVIMASIIQREAGTSHDRYLIASVYLNRLRDKSGTFAFLNADPTVQHAIGTSADWWPQPSPSDITRTAGNPFNTYKHPGLPPAPIAEPNLDSIEAAVHPAHTDYFYFYHVNGSHGKSIFCTAAQGNTCQTPPQ